LKKRKATSQSIILFIALLFFLSYANGQVQGEVKAQKKRGSINLTMGIAKSNDNEKGNFGLLKSVGWNLFSGWVSAGINFGIVKNEIMAMGNVTLNAPLKRIEPFATAGYGIIVETFQTVSNYGGGIRFRLGQHVGIVTEYRKLHFKQKDKQRDEESKIIVDYFGAGIFYYF
jgi:hypothetical protein